MSTPDDIPHPERRRAMLQRLAELGMVMAEKLAAQEEVTAQAAMQFARVAKAVRQTIALEHRLEQDKARSKTSEAIGEITERGPLKRRRLMDGFRRKTTLAQRVADSYEQSFDEDSFEREQLNEKLDAFVEPTLEDDLYLDRPAGEIIIEIMHGLGLVPADSETFSRADWEAAVRERYAVLDPAPGANELAWPAQVRGAPHQRPPDG